MKSIFFHYLFTLAWFVISYEIVSNSIITQAASLKENNNETKFNSTGEIFLLNGKCASKSSCKQRLHQSFDIDYDTNFNKNLCYCDEKCNIFDDCCLDSNFTSTFEQRKLIGLKDIYLQRRQWHCKQINNIYGDVLMKASCPSNWLKNNQNSSIASLIQNRCEKSKQSNLDFQSDPLGLLLPITDTISGITYANSYCLQCNQILTSTDYNKTLTKFIYWSPLLECNYNTKSDDRIDLIDLINANKGQVLTYSSEKNRWIIKVDNSSSIENNTRECIIAPSIPDSIEHLIRYCKTNLIDTCPTNETNSISNKTRIEQQMILECQFGHQSLVFSQNNDLVYFNLACAKCNGEKQISCEAEAKKNHFTSSKVGNIDGRQFYSPNEYNETESNLNGNLGNSAGNSIIGSFAVLMDLYGAWQGDDNVGVTHQCPEMLGQVYDPFFLTCRHVICGLNQQHIDGRCITTKSQQSHLKPTTFEDNQMIKQQSSSITSTSNEPKISQTNKLNELHLTNSTQPTEFAILSSSTARSFDEFKQDTNSSAKLELLPSAARSVQNLTKDQISTDKILNQFDLNELPETTVESRQQFVDCAKFLVQDEHYRLFTANQTGSHKRLLNSTELINVTKSNQIWAYIIPYELILASSQFELVRSQQQVDSLKLLICSPFRDDLVAKFKPAMGYLTIVCLLVSIASLAFYLVLYVLSTLDLRKLVTRMNQQAEIPRLLLDKNRLSRTSNELASSISGHSTSAANSSCSSNCSSGTNTNNKSQSLSSRGVACLAGSLLSAYLLFIGGHQVAIKLQMIQHEHSKQTISFITSSCFILAIATYYCFLVAFNWMFLLSYDIWRTLRLATRHLRAPASHSQSTRFLIYSFISLLAAALITSIAILFDQIPLSCQEKLNNHQLENCTNILFQFEQFVSIYKPKFGYRAGSCWFSNRKALALFFGIPVISIMFLNLLFFLHSSFMVLKTSSKSSRHFGGCNQTKNSTTSTNEKQLRSSSIDKSCCLDFVQQNSLTTSSMISVQTIQSNLSASDESSCDEIAVVPPPDGATRTPTKRKLEQTDSSSSLHSAGASSIAASLAMKYDAHLQNLAGLVGSIASDYQLYCRLSTIMGLTWLTGLMASLVDQSELLWYLFVLLNTLQGLFIFIAFGCKKSKLANLEILLSYAKFRLNSCRK